MSEEVPAPVILRGLLIEEFATRELLALYEQLEEDLPPTVGELTEEHAGALTEMELIEDELYRRSRLRP